MEDPQTAADFVALVIYFLQLAVVSKLLICQICIQ